MRKRISTSAAIAGLIAMSMAHGSSESPEIRALCERIDEKLSSVRFSECMRIGLRESGAYSNRETIIAYRDFLPPRQPPVARVLLVGGIHGDEYSSVSVVFKWLKMLQEEAGDRFHWRVVPVLNPDGLLMPPRKSQRMNANGVDLNRNFPTPDWEKEAPEYWIKRTNRSERRYPGPAALSEPESTWLAQQIESFQPHAVVSVHAPHGIVDFDGPRVPPESLGPLELRLLGTYPGSMGRYIGVHKGIPLLTVELESAWRMPESKDVVEIWTDMIEWLDAKVVPGARLATNSEVDAELTPIEVLRRGGRAGAQPDAKAATVPGHAQAEQQSGLAVAEANGETPPPLLPMNLAPGFLAPLPDPTVLASPVDLYATGEVWFLPPVLHVRPLAVPPGASQVADSESDSAPQRR